MPENVPPTKRRRPPRPGRDRDEDRRREEIEVKGGGSHASSSAVTGSMEAPADVQDFAQDSTDDRMQAFFSTGTGAAQHYHGTADGGVGQEAPQEPAA